MPTKRRRIGPRQIRHAAGMPGGVRWWLEHGQSISVAEAIALGMAPRDAWIASNLHYARPIRTGWTRADLRQMGFGALIDQHIAAGRCPEDDWRTPPSAEVVRLDELSSRNREPGQ